jgi:hypothetical protein
MVLGGLLRIDLLECEAHPSFSPESAHVRTTAFTNLPIHVTGIEKAETYFKEHPFTLASRESSVTLIVKEPVGDGMKVGLELDVKSTGNAERNTIEIVFAGLGFVAIGGNFQRAKFRVWSPAGRGVGVRRPVVKMINGLFSLEAGSTSIHEQSLASKARLKYSEMGNLKTGTNNLEDPVSEQDESGELRASEIR